MLEKRTRRYNSSKRGVHSCRLLSLADFGHFLRRECLVVQSNAMIQSRQAVSLWAAQTWMSDQCRKIIARARTKPGSDGSRWRSLTWPGGFPSGWPGRSCASTSVPPQRKSRCWCIRRLGLQDTLQTCGRGSPKSCHDGATGTFGAASHPPPCRTGTRVGLLR